MTADKKTDRETTVTSILQDIADASARERARILDGLRTYVRAGKDGEAAVQTLFAETAEALGCSVEASSYNPADVRMIEEFAGEAAIDPQARTSIIARCKGAGNGRSLILFAHPDGEPVKGTDRWRHDPFAGEVEDGRLYGWGVADDLSGVAAGLQALELLASLGLRPDGDVLIASTPSKRHARGVSRLMQEGMTADAALYLHPAESGVGLREIKALASGQVEFRVIVEGRHPPTTEPLQTAFGHLGVNAIDKAFIVWEALKKLDARRGEEVHHPALHGEVGRSTNIMMSYISAGDPKRLARLATSCTLGAALAFPPPEKLSDVCAQIEAAIAEAAANDPWLSENPPRIVWDSGTTGAEVPGDHPLLLAAHEAIRGVCGLEAHVNPMHTGSDIRNPMIQKDIPTIGIGPLCGNLSQNDGVDEWVDTEDHVRFVGAVAGIIAQWCGVSKLQA